MLRGKIKLARSNRGQASVMIGMMMMTFMLFFTFVVNTGMLVNAKINLQNAADLAAYAGAATQARQLTQISYLNYEMRRAYKKFLYRYYIMGNVSQGSFLTQGNGKNAHVWSPNGDPAFNFQVPSVCLTFNPTDNFCHVPTLTKLDIPASNPTDMINQTLIGQLQALEAIREANCGDIGQNNTQVLLLWLYNTDPSLQALISQQTNQSTQGMLAVTQAVSTGLGLIPREIILHQRIKTVQGYVNEDAQTNVQLSTVNSMKQAQDPAANERTIQAFLSAYYTLGPSIFPESDQPTLMDEMIPGPANGGTLLTLNDIKTSFDTYAVGYVKDNIVGTGASQTFDCKAALIPVPVQNVPLGVYKDPSALTYYAIRLKARAKIMFSPFGDLDLKAYAAARPFGSRIGPPMPTNGPNGFVRPVTPPGIDLLVSTGLAGQVPNLPITEGDSADLGWNTNFALQLYYPALFIGGPTSVINGSNAASGYLAAMAPNPYEGNLYNIINDQNEDPFVRNFDTTHHAAFWAPVFPPDKVASLQTTLKSTLQDIYGTGAANVGQVNAVSSGTTADPNFVSSLQSGLTTYLGLLANQQGEEGEGMNVVRITDPFNDSNGQPIKLDPQIMLTDPAQIKTSWVTENSSSNPNYTALGRVGYSVKFVSFDSLKTGQGTSNGTDHWKNFYMDGEAEDDGVGQMQH